MDNTNSIFEQPAVEKSTFQPQFKGTGAEYFKIWIVNLVLSILTIGIYSAWATVRSRRYFAGNTYLDGHNFDFHGSAKAILIGRVITLILIAGYTLGQYVNVYIPQITFVIIILIAPILVVKGLRFRLSNTSHRNLRFNFNLNYKQAFYAFWPLYLIVIISVSVIVWIFIKYNLREMQEIVLKMTSGFNSVVSFIMLLLIVMPLVLYPLFIYLFSKFKFSNIKFGDHLFTCSLKPRSIFYLYFKLYLFVMAIIFLFGIFMNSFLLVSYASLQELFDFDSKLFQLALVIVLYIVFIPIYLIIFAYYKAELSNLIYSSLQLEQIEFVPSWRMRTYFTLILGNTVMVILTLGLAYPWAAVRLARYKADHILLKTVSLDEFTGGSDSQSSAIGDEVAEGFDIEFGI